MSRGGRRRKGKRGRRSVGPGERRPQGEHENEELEPPPSKRRGSGRSAALREASVLEQMTTRHTTLQTLPPDGIVLEELIGALQSEYGVPTTPQEYRLIIKTPMPEEPTDPSIEVKPAAPAAVGDVSEGGEQDEEAALTIRSSRRRRRGRRRSGSASPGEVDVLDEGPEPGKPAVPD